MLNLSDKFNLERLSYLGSFVTRCLKISNYWMRLSRIWRILQIKEGVIHRDRRPRWITPSEICRISYESRITLSILCVMHSLSNIIHLIRHVTRSLLFSPQSLACSCLDLMDLCLMTTWQDGKLVHCKYLSVVPYKALEKFSKALYGTTGGTYSARVFRPVMLLLRKAPGPMRVLHPTLESWFYGCLIAINSTSFNCLLFIFSAHQCGTITIISESTLINDLKWSLMESETTNSWKKKQYLINL